MRTWNRLSAVMCNQWLFQIMSAILLGHVNRVIAAPEAGQWDIIVVNVSTTTEY